MTPRWAFDPGPPDSVNLAAHVPLKRTTEALPALGALISRALTIAGSSCPPLPAKSGPCARLTYLPAPWSGSVHFLVEIPGSGLGSPPIMQILAAAGVPSWLSLSA